MPAAAYALLGVFTALAVAAGIAAARIVGPWRRWTPVVPALVAFVALWLTGHRLGVAGGPSVNLLGFRVSIVLDVVVAVVAALIAAAAQSAALRLLDADERGARRDRLT